MRRRMLLRGGLRRATELTGSVYRGAKYFTPSFVRSRVENVEGWVTARSEPFGRPLDHLLTVCDSEIEHQVLEPAEIRVHNGLQRTKNRIKATGRSARAVVTKALEMGKFLPGGCILAGVVQSITQGAALKGSPAGVA